MKKLFLKLFLFSLLSSPLCAELDTCSERFDHVLTTLQDAVEKQVFKKGQSYNPLVLFYQGVSTAQCDFAQIEQAFAEGTLHEHKKMHKAFDKFCKTVAQIDAALSKPTNLRPRHVRWLCNGCHDLGKASRALIGNVQVHADMMLVQTIRQFAITMVRDVIPPCSRYIGTGFEGMTDLLIHRPWDFFKRNWWWTVPLTAAGIKLAYDAKTFLESQRVNPETWNMQADGQPESSKYKKLLSLIAAGLFASQLGSGYVKMDGHTYVGEPIGRVANNNEREVTRTRVELKRNESTNIVSQVTRRERRRLVGLNHSRHITQLPGLSQGATADCGYFALYNALCFATNTETVRLLDRAQCSGMIRNWKNSVREIAQQNQQDGVRAKLVDTGTGWLRPEMVHWIIEHNIPELRNANDPQGFAPNVSIIEKATIDPALQARGQGDQRNLVLPEHWAFNIDGHGTFIPNNVAENIARFRFAQQPQTVILQTGGMRGHWRAFKLVSEGDNVRIYIVESLGCKDIRSSTQEIVDWLYHLFCVQDIEGLDRLARHMRLI